jgi:filamentous hemagglutinin
VPVANDFANKSRLRSHFYEHRHEFGATSIEDYLAKAKAFLTQDITDNPDILECVRNNGTEIVRFNQRTNEFAVVTATGTIKTYFKPQPARTAPPGTPLRKKHRFHDNLSYYRNECQK